MSEERSREVNSESERPKKSARGFASMDRAKQKEIASKGGKAAHASGKAHEFDAAEAAEAGRKGGLKVSENREHMSKIGSNGRKKRSENEQKNGIQVNPADAKSNFVPQLPNDC